MLNCMERPPARERGSSGLVMSWMLALPLNWALHGEVAVAPVQPAAQEPDINWYTASEVMEFPLIWYTRPPLRTMVLMLPCSVVPCLYWTLKPKLFFVPGSPAMVPAERCITKKPPPVIIPAPT